MPVGVFVFGGPQGSFSQSLSPPDKPIIYGHLTVLRINPPIGELHPMEMGVIYNP